MEESVELIGSTLQELLQIHDRRNRDIPIELVGFH